MVRWLSLHEVITMLVDLSKKELDLLGIALAEYQFDKENWYLQEVKQLNIKLMNIRNACTCKEDASTN